MAKLQTSPGNAHSPSRLCPPHLRTSFPYRYRTLKILAFSSSLHASYAISVRRASALPAASFRFHLAMDTLAVRLTIPPVGFVGDFHSLVRAPCRAHKRKGATVFGLSRLILCGYCPHPSNHLDGRIHQPSSWGYYIAQIFYWQQAKSASSVLIL